MLIALLVVLLVIVMVFAVLSFALHHLFLIGLVIAAIILIGHGGALFSRLKQLLVGDACLVNRPSEARTRFA